MIFARVEGPKENLRALVSFVSGCLSRSEKDKGKNVEVQGYEAKYSAGNSKTYCVTIYRSHLIDQSRIAREIQEAIEKIDKATAVVSFVMR